MGFCRRTMMGFALLVMVTGQAVAAPNQYSESRSTQAAALDIIVARPVGIVVTGVGALLFAVSLPFSLLGGNVDEAAEMLVIKPARETFARCLGCTSSQQRRALDDR